MNFGCELLPLTTGGFSTGTRGSIAWTALRPLALVPTAVAFWSLYRYLPNKQRLLTDTIKFIYQCHVFLWQYGIDIRYFSPQVALAVAA